MGYEAQAVALTLLPRTAPSYDSLHRGFFLPQCSTKLQRRLAVIRHLAREPPERACHDADIVLRQAPFGPEGFASTVWDSSIVVSKMLERSPGLVRGKLCWDLSAGCGLVAAVMARLGASHVVASDLAPNLPLLRCVSPPYRRAFCVPNRGNSSPSRPCTPPSYLRWAHFQLPLISTTQLHHPV